MRYASLKLMPRFGNLSIDGPEFQDKHKCGRPKCECRRLKHKHGRYINRVQWLSRKLTHVRSQRSSEEAFHVFGRNLTILGRSLSICRRSLPFCGKNALQTHFGKLFRIAASILKTRTIDYICWGSLWDRLLCDWGVSNLWNGLMEWTDGMEYQLAKPYVYQYNL